jgi:hypothetical protein
LILHYLCVTNLIQNKMKIGFDELYVVVRYDKIIDCECLFSSKEADIKVKELTKNGYHSSKKITLEYAFHHNYTTE